MDDAAGQAMRVSTRGCGAAVSYKGKTCSSLRTCRTCVRRSMNSVLQHAAVNQPALSCVEVEIL